MFGIGGSGLNPLSSMIPGMQVIELVTKGVELMKGLFEKGDLQGTQKMLDFLNEIVNKEGKGGMQQQPAPAEQQPYNAPQTWDPNNNSNQPVTIRIQIGNDNNGAKPVSHDLLPTVDGSAAGDQRLSDTARQFVDGSDAAKSRALKPGSNEWTTVMWAMHANPNVRYDADNQKFTMKMSDGSTRDLCSLAEAQSKVGPTGFDRGNPQGMYKIADFLNQQIQKSTQGSNGVNEIVLTLTNAANQASDTTKETAATPHQAEDLAKKVEELKAKLKEFEEALKMLQQSQQMSQPGALDVKVSVA